MHEHRSTKMRLLCGVIDGLSLLYDIALDSSVASHSNQEGQFVAQNPFPPKCHVEECENPKRNRQADKGNEPPRSKSCVLGKIYLSAYALGLGASGSTFYDDASTEFFSPRAEKMSTMVVAGIGIPDYRAQEGKVLVPRLTRSQLLQSRA